MEQNIFEELREKKQNLVTLAKKATEFGWITIERQKEIIEKLENDVLTIGVIGQMKCGKSTFLNSFVFEDDILPAATTPMTAALSVITYGAEKKIIAEFYNQNEWEEQKMQASRSLEDVQGNSLEESKVKAAKELVDRSYKLGNNINSHLGSKKEDKLENLIDYVGADGKYISITKSVTIYYPKEYLKGVEIVDTPGFNDPIVSREERTKSFLKKADVVLMMLYAGRPFDSTDRDILFQNVRQCGIGKVIIGINKYDLPYSSGESIEEITEYVKKEIKKACKTCDDNSLVDILKETEPIPLSAEMALLSELPMNKITSNEAFQYAWKRACDIFEISNQKQMREKSHLDNLTTAIKQMVETEKGKILFNKPLNVILVAGNNKKGDIEKELRECDSLINNLKLPNNELEEKQENLDKAKRKLERKIKSLGDSIELIFNNINRKGKEQLLDAVDDTCKKMRNIVDNWGRFSSINNITTALDRETQELITRTLRRKVEDTAQEAKIKIKKEINTFLGETEDILRRYLPDFEHKEFIVVIDKKIQIDIDNDELFSTDNSNEEEKFNWENFLYSILNNVSWGVAGKVGEVISYDENKRELHKFINSICYDFDPNPYLENICLHKENIISLVQKLLFDELINVMQTQIEDICSEKDKKESSLKEAETNHKKLLTKKDRIIKEIEEINLSTILSRQ